jgi:hypothetical protein
LFDREDVAGLAAALRRVLGDPALAATLGENAERYAQACLSDRRWMVEMHQMIAGVLEARVP